LCALVVLKAATREHALVTSRPRMVPLSHLIAYQVNKEGLISPNKRIKISLLSHYLFSIEKLLLSDDNVTVFLYFILNIKLKLKSYK